MVNSSSVLFIVVLSIVLLGEDIILQKAFAAILIFLCLLVLAL